jgi:two-component system response regulator MtrA
MVRKLLIIDDESGIATIVSLTARQLGMDVLSLTSSANALTVFRDYRPDIVLLDMIMPDKDGIAVLHDILVP